MQTKLILAALLAANSFIMPVMAQNDNKQCEMIASLTGDYFVQRLKGKTIEQIQQETPVEIINSDFFPIVVLAVSIAFNFDKTLNEDEIEAQVYDSCIRNHP